MSIEENEFVYRIVDNGHDYEVIVEKSGRLFYQNMGFESVEDAERFVAFFRTQLGLSTHE